MVFQRFSSLIVILIVIAGCSVDDPPEIVFQIEPQYEDASAFSEGLAAVQHQGKWGYINQSGEYVIDLLFLRVAGFSEGMAAVWDGNRWGYVDQAGNIVVDLQYSGVRTYREGLTWVCQDGKDGKWGMMDKFGKMILQPMYDNAFSFSEGLARVELDGEWGFVDRNGKVVIPLIYDQVRSFSEGLAAIRNISSYGRKRGFMDQRGRIVIYPKRDYYPAWDFNEGLAVFWAQDGYRMKYGFIDKNEEVIIEPKLFWVSRFSEGRARISRAGNIGFINRNGDAVIPYKYPDSHSAYSEGLVGVMWKGDLWGFIDLEGEVAVPFIFEDVSEFSEGLAAVRVDGKWGYIAKSN